ncbi:MAG: hypothetical protein KIT72_17230 [Polyangiaceae bacterium]|nr:hypothetical protein [Polyangiaceae bacterium]MCW5792162.1 hypothetical protein [Polyangiaceae bacterium]
MSRLFVVSLLAIAVGGCATYREDLNRGERLYAEDKDYERALAIWRSLEADRDSLSLQDQARYAYLRGMTGYRLGFRADARHWLAIAKAIEQEHPGGLKEPEKARLEESLTDLNHDVFGTRDSLGSSSSTVKETSRDAEGCSPACAEGETCQAGECVTL